MTRRLAELTTIGLGGPPERLIEATSEEQLVAAVGQADAGGEPLLVLAGGSNVVVSDEGIAGTALLVRTSGISRDGVRLDVAAGESWDVVVAACVADGLSGIECLSGIPGTVGATPIQNVGAYGQEVAETIVAVRALDRRSGQIASLSPAECGFSYRSSAFKREPGRWIVLGVSFELGASPASQPIRYDELAAALGVANGGRAPLAAVREAVLALRRSKGMVIDPADPDTRSVGSFFTNPVLEPEAFGELAGRSSEAPPAWADAEGRVKTSAAWLIRRAGFAPGYGSDEGIAISTKHALALTNRGSGTSSELLALAREVAAGVEQTFGIMLEPEPRLVGLPWP